MFADSCRAVLIHTSWAAVLLKYCFIPKSESSSSPKAMWSQACICKKWERSAQDLELNLFYFTVVLSDSYPSVQLSPALQSLWQHLSGCRITHFTHSWQLNRCLTVNFKYLNILSILSKAATPWSPKSVSSVVSRSALRWEILTHVQENNVCHNHW